MTEETNEQEKEEITLSPDDKKMLINTINKKGFFLEEKGYGVLSQREGRFLLRKNFIPEKYNKQFENDRIEIDLVFQNYDKNLIIECKKTDFSWVFPKSLVGSNNVNYIYELGEEAFIRSFEEDKWKVSYSEPMAMMIKDDGTLIPLNKEFVKTQSRQEDPIQRAVRRVLYQTKAWRWDQKLKQNYAFFIPLILTNAPILFLDYKSDHINGDSNLIDYNSLKKVNAIIYNYPEILDWPNVKDEREFKSVFIVNIHHFKEFLDWILEQDMRGLNQRAKKQ